MNMAIQLQTRNTDLTDAVWTCDGETNRAAPTKFMLENAREYRREMPHFETRFVYDKRDFVK